MPYNFDINNIEHFGNDNIEHLEEPNRLEVKPTSQSSELSNNQTNEDFKKRLNEIRGFVSDLAERTDEFENIEDRLYDNLDEVSNYGDIFSTKTLEEILVEHKIDFKFENKLEEYIFRLYLSLSPIKDYSTPNDRIYLLPRRTWPYCRKDTDRCREKLRKIRIFESVLSASNNILIDNIQNSGLNADKQLILYGLFQDRVESLRFDNNYILKRTERLIEEDLQKEYERLKEKRKKFRPMTLNNELKLINDVLDRANVVNNYKDLQTKTIFTNITKLITGAVPEEALHQDEAMIVNNTATIIDSVFNIADTLFPYTGNEKVYQKYFTLYNKFLNPKQLKILFSNIRDNVDINKERWEQNKIQEIIASYLHDFLSTKEIFDLLIFIVLYVPNLIERVKKLETDEEYFKKMSVISSLEDLPRRIPLNFVAKVMTNVLNDLEIPLEPFIMFRVFIEALMNSFIAPFDTVPEIIASTHLFNRFVLSMESNGDLKLLEYFFTSLDRVMSNTFDNLENKGSMNSDSRQFLSKYMLKDYNKINIPDNALVKGFYNLIDNTKKLSSDPSFVGHMLNEIDIFDNRVCDDAELLSIMSKMEALVTKATEAKTLNEMENTNKEFEIIHNSFLKKMSVYGIKELPYYDSEKFEKIGSDCTLFSKGKLLQTQLQQAQENHNYIKSESTDETVDNPTAPTPTAPTPTAPTAPTAPTTPTTPTAPTAPNVIQPVSEPFKNSNLEGFSKYRTINMILIVGILLVVVLGYFYYKNNMSEVDDINFELTETPLVGNNMDIDMDYNFD